ADAPALYELLQRSLVEAADPPAAAIDDPEFLDVEVMPAEFVQDAHLLGHVVAEAPKVDDIAAGARFGRLFHQAHRISAPIEPPGEAGACHSGSRHENCPRHGTFPMADRVSDLVMAQGPGETGPPTVARPDPVQPTGPLRRNFWIRMPVS